MSARPTPVMVPPVPTPATKCVTRPRVWSPDLGARGLLVRQRIRGVGVLIGPKRVRASHARAVRRSSSTSAGLRAAPPWGTPRPRRRTTAATRSSRRSSCRSSRRCSGTRAARRRSRARRRCCPTWARRWCRPAAADRRVRRRRSSRSATRSFTLPPGLTVSTFASSVHRRSSASLIRRRRTRGVFPTRSRIESAYSISGGTTRRYPPTDVHLALRRKRRAPRRGRRRGAARPVRRGPDPTPGQPR